MIFQYYWCKLFKKIHGRAIINSRIHKTSKIEAGSEIVNSLFKKYSFCGYNCEIINSEIGSFCSIANNVIIGGAMHPMNWVSMSPVFYEGRDSIKEKFSLHKRETPIKTIIGNDVWIGNGAIIKQGVKVGTGAVIGMGSVVTKDVDPYNIVAGTPAKFIRKRFNDDISDALLKSEWWSFSDVEIKRFAPCFNNPELFLKEINR